jgi:ubiquinone/menaquinone biosynthesis C-methylase UbiE
VLWSISAKVLVEMGVEPGMVVVDLQVGSEGQVVGVYMTEEMLGRSRAAATAMHLGNVEFRQGVIEDLPKSPDHDIALMGVHRL